MFLSLLRSSPCSSFYPGAYAPGYILVPLRGWVLWERAGGPASEKQKGRPEGRPFDLLLIRENP